MLASEHLDGAVGSQLAALGVHDVVGMLQVDAGDLRLRKLEARRFERVQHRIMQELDSDRAG
eukprot:COSAG01_NODE_492_length_16335_cov_63.722284_14_plen_62_part_00